MRTGKVQKSDHVRHRPEFTSAASANGREDLCGIAAARDGPGHEPFWRTSFAGIVRIRFQGLDQTILSAVSAFGTGQGKA